MRMSEVVKVGDIVGRRSYNSDTMFRIENIVDETAYLKGIFFRLTADAPLNDLEVISSEEYQRAEQVEFDQYRTILPPVMSQMRSYDTGIFILADGFYMLMEMKSTFRRVLSCTSMQKFMHKPSLLRKRI